MLENNLTIILLIFIILIFLISMIIYIYNKRELDFLKDRIKYNKEIESNEQDAREKRISSLLEPLTNELEKLQNNINYIVYELPSN